MIIFFANWYIYIYRENFLYIPPACGMYRKLSVYIYIRVVVPCRYYGGYLKLAVGKWRRLWRVDMNTLRKWSIMAVYVTLNYFLENAVALKRIINYILMPKYQLEISFPKDKSTIWEEKGALYRTIYATT